MTELRAQIHDHLQRYPWLSAYEITRALRGPDVSWVRKTLARMAADGEVESRPRPRGDTETRSAIEWRTT